MRQRIVWLLMGCVFWCFSAGLAAADEQHRDRCEYSRQTGLARFLTGAACVPDDSLDHRGRPPAPLRCCWQGNTDHT